MAKFEISFYPRSPDMRLITQLPVCQVPAPRISGTPQFLHAASGFAEHNRICRIKEKWSVVIMFVEKKPLSLFCVLLLLLTAVQCPPALSEEKIYSCEVFPLERNGIALHLDCLKTGNSDPAKHILLIHGSTYSSHEFDIDYQDYSLVRRLAREGYAVWRLDIAGYGQSGSVDDGFLPDTVYAAKDVHAAVERIVQISGQDKVDVLGWSWGTMITGRLPIMSSENR